MARKRRVLVAGGWYHVVNLCTPRDAIRWLPVSNSRAFDRAHRTRGHLFQGRFRSLLVEDRKGVVEVARYLHLQGLWGR